MERKSAQETPASEVQRTIIRSRRKSVGDKAQGVVVAVSLAATLLGWGFAANQDAQNAALAAAANSAQVIEVSNTIPAIATVTVQPTATPVVSTTQSSTTTTTQSNITTTQAAFTTTQSSR